MKKLLIMTAAMGVFVSLSTSSVSAEIPTMPVIDHHNDNVVITEPNAANMNIQIVGGDYAVGEAYWKSFNIGKGGNVNVEFTAGAQTSLNYVDAAGGMSYIYGNFTNTGCGNCFAKETGKVILVNPNGILFGETANVNLNSFTATNMYVDGDYKTFSEGGLSGELKLKKTGIVLKDADGNIISRDIIVKEGANIYGDKGVTLASDDNIITQKGSLISTNTDTLNVDTTNAKVTAFDAAYGKVKLVTSDGVTFSYKNSGTLHDIPNIEESSRAMTISLEGDIDAGHIDARNMSTNTNSRLNVNGAKLKATKATVGNDGNIWLTSRNQAIVANAELDAGGNIKISSAKNTNLTNDKLNAGGYVKLEATDGDTVVDTSTIDAKGDVTLTASNVASVQMDSVITGKNVTVDGAKKGQVVERGKINGENIIIRRGDVWFEDAELTATNKISADATGYIASSSKSTFKAPEIEFNAGGNVTGFYDFNKNAPTITSGDSIDVTLYNVDNPNKGLNARAVNNVTIETPGTLSVSSLISENGDMTIKSEKIIQGLPYSTVNNLPDDPDTPRALISVENGTFTSIPNGEVSASGGRTYVGDDGKTYQVKHHINFGDQNFVLINPRAKIDDTPRVVTTDSNAVKPNDDEIERTKIPHQLETYDGNVEIKNNRTETSTIFAAAAAIEIEED